MRTLQITSGTFVTGKSTSTRIVGGTEVRHGEVPWRVSLLIGTESSEDISGFVCAGTIVAPSWVLTAAHCFTNYKSGMVVQVRAGNVHRWEATPVYARSYRKHEKYDSPPKMNDIALVELAQELRFSSSIAAACLPYEWQGLTELTGKVMTSGWGDVREATGEGSEVMMKVPLDVIGNKECQALHDHIVPTTGKLEEIRSTQVCTLTPDKDACQGDSGSSIDAFDGLKWHVFGVVSYGHGCARDSTPGVYTRVSEYTTWIEQQTGQTFCRT